MKVYDLMNKGPNGEHTVYVSPGKLDKSATNADWFGEDGVPLQIAVRFRGGEAQVEDSLGRLMIAHNLARKTRPLYRAA